MAGVESGKEVRVRRREAREERVMRREVVRRRGSGSRAGRREDA